MEMVHPPLTGPWHERGTTISGAPRGYTIDASASGSEIIAEFSSEEDYFKFPAKKKRATKKKARKTAVKKAKKILTKPERDIEHAITMHPSVKKIYLLSSNESSAGQYTETNNLIAKYKSSNRTLDDIIALDARHIAIEIYAQLESEKLIRELSSYLPSLERLADEHAISHRIPKYDAYVTRKGTENLIIKKLRDQPIVQLAGISGIGKSALAAAVSKRLSDDYEAVYWIQGREMQTVSKLSDIDVRRNGIHHNLLATIRRMKCLLVIDEFGFKWEELIATNIGQSSILVTTQTATISDAFTVNDVLEKEAKNILTEQVNEPLSDILFDQVYRKVGGYPLLLSALNRIALEDGWAAVEDCLEDVTSSVEDDRNQNICRRILHHHQHKLRDELAFIKWCGTQSVDVSLGKYCVNSRWDKKMDIRRFLSASSYGSIKVHDVVYDSIQSEISVNHELETRFLSKLKKMFREGCNSDRITLQRITNRHADLIQRLVTQEKSPELIYATALNRSNDAEISLYDSMIANANQLAKKDYTPDLDIQIRAIIESVESKYTLTSQKTNNESAKTDLAIDILALEALTNIPKSPVEIHRDTQHHYAKMLMRLDRDEEAQKIFRSILKDFPSSAAARLQLARILAKDPNTKTEALSEANRICNQHEKNPADVSPHILLESLRLIAFKSPDHILTKRQFVHSVINRSGEFDITMSVSLIAQIAAKMWYSHPNFVTELFSLLDWCNIVPNSDNDRFSWAQAYKNTAKAHLELGTVDQKTIETALEHFRSIRKPNDYQLTQHGECAIIADELDEANSTLERVESSKRNDHWHYRKAETLNQMGESKEAASHIEKSIEATRHDYLMSARLALRSEIRISQGDLEEAKDDLRAAITSTSNHKYRSTLEQRLKNL